MSSVKKNTLPVILVAPCKMKADLLQHLPKMTAGEVLEWDQGISKSSPVGITILVGNLFGFLQAEQEIAHWHRGVDSRRAIMIMSNGDVHRVPTLLDGGVSAFLDERSAMNELKNAIQVVSSGGAYISRSLLNALLHPLRQDEQKKRQIADLTLREREILSLIVTNMSNKDIARRLHLSVRTVETHRLNIRKKTHVNDWQELATLAETIGIKNAMRYPQPSSILRTTSGFHED